MTRHEKNEERIHRSKLQFAYKWEIVSGVLADELGKVLVGIIGDEVGQINEHVFGV